MKNVLQLILFLGVLQMSFGQNNQHRIISSNLGSSGSSQMVETSKGRYYVSQSVGQSSVIGTYQGSGYYLRQGYQQPVINIGTIRNLDMELKAKVFPNPFSQMLFLTFSDLMRNDISVNILNVEAKAIYTKVFLPAQRVELHLQNFSSGTYFLKVSTGKKYFNTKLIKI